VINAPGYRLSLRSRILLPYVLLALVLTVAATYMVSAFIVATLETHLDGHLATKTQVVQGQLNRVAVDHQALWQLAAASGSQAKEASHLSSSMMPGGLAGDSVLRNVTSTYSILPDDALFTTGQATTPANVIDWTWLPATLDRENGPSSNAWTAGGEPVLYTAGWVLDAAQGGSDYVLIIATPLPAILEAISLDTLVGVTLYNTSGRPFATTLGREHLNSMALSDETRDRLSQENTMLTRWLNLSGGEYQQGLLSLTPDLAWTGGSYLGISMAEQALHQDAKDARLLVLAILGMSIIGTLIIARTSTARIERPVQDLMVASQQVAAGDLEVQVDIHSDDELGELAHSFNAMVNQLRQRRYLESLLGRYVGDNIARRILDGDAELTGRRVWATALFADIRDFSAFTQKADLSELLDELNEYYETMQRVIDAHGGVVNKFGGDSILALFGAPVPHKDHPHRAIQAAVAMMDELSKLNSQRLSRGVAPIRIGIGVNTGQMIEGNLGSDKRREYTVLGDSVNLAKRLSDLNKETPFDTVFVGEATLKSLESTHTWQIDDLGFVMVKGQVEPVRIFSVMHRTFLA
jgi:adenylate cyclase